MGEGPTVAFGNTFFVSDGNAASSQWSAPCRSIYGNGARLPAVSPIGSYSLHLEYLHKPLPERAALLITTWQLLNLSLVPFWNRPARRLVAR